MPDNSCQCFVQELERRTLFAGNGSFVYVVAQPVNPAGASLHVVPGLKGVPTAAAPTSSGEFAPGWREVLGGGPVISVEGASTNQAESVAEPASQGTDVHINFSAIPVPGLYPMGSSKFFGNATIASSIDVVLPELA
jgi:hypothetical protein